MIVPLSLLPKVYLRFDEHEVAAHFWGEPAALGDRHLGVLAVAVPGTTVGNIAAQRVGQRRAQPRGVPPAILPPTSPGHLPTAPPMKTSPAYHLACQLYAGYGADTEAAIRHARGLGTDAPSDLKLTIDV